MLAVAMRDPQTGARWLFGSLCALLVWRILTRNPIAYLTLFTGAIPATMMLRDYFYFNSVTVIFAAGFLLWYVVRTPEFSRIWRQRAFTGFFVIALLYWWISYLRMGTYSSNLRFLELAFSAASIVLLGRYRSYLATALTGIGITAVIVGAGLAPYGTRLGLADFGEASLGNPISLGLPAALVLLLAFAHNGRWLLAEGHPLLRGALLVAVGICLLLSTSRGSWLVAVAGFLVVFAGSRRGRISILASLIPLVVAGVLVMASGRGQFVSMYFERALDPERTLAQRTTGRYYQWVAMPRIFAESPVWGYGPGSGLATNVRFTGSHKAWHSLYLQISVETGTIGLVLMALLFGSLLARGMRHRNISGDAVPLMGTLCYMTIAISVSGVDAISGVFLGLGFLAQDFTGTYVLREVYTGPAPDRYASPVAAA